MNSMRHAHADGWFIVFDTLTLADYRLEEFDDNPNALLDYVRYIGLCVLAAECRKANDSQDDRHFYFFVFFFQAEDGIRDLTVTGVQTCALPISCRRGARGRRSVVFRFVPPRRCGQTPGHRNNRRIAVRSWHFARPVGWSRHARRSHAHSGKSPPQAWAPARAKARRASGGAVPPSARVRWRTFAALLQTGFRRVVSSSRRAVETSHKCFLDSLWPSPLACGETLQARGFPPRSSAATIAAVRESG